MSFDMSKLTPAPWVYNGAIAVWTPETGDGQEKFIAATGGSFDEWQAEGKEANAAFIALARNAFDGDPEALAWWETNRRRRDDTPLARTLRRSIEKVEKAKKPK